MAGSAFKKGDAVRQILPAPVEGVIAGVSICQESLERQFLVVWPDADGDGIEESRYFNEDQIELVKK